MSGTVQICFNRYWGNICDKPRFGFGFQEAHVVCHQLGYSGASKVVSSRYIMCICSLKLCPNFILSMNLLRKPLQLCPLAHGGSPS